MTRPSILIIPGASGLPELYDLVVKPLTARGFDIKALHLPSIGLVTGPRPGQAPGMYEDAAFIAEHIMALADEEKDVLIVTHSYGGTPGTESIRGLSKQERMSQGKKGGVVRIAYMTSLIPIVGRAAQDVVAANPRGGRIPMTQDENGWMSYTDIPQLAAISFRNMPREEGEAAAASLVTHSEPSFADELTYAGFKDVPVSYLVCNDDLAITPQKQRAGIAMIERESGRKVDVTAIDADHVAPLSAPELVITWLTDVAGKD